MNTALILFCCLACLLSVLCVLIVLTQNNFDIHHKMTPVLGLISCSIVIGFWMFFQGKIPLLNQAYFWVASFPINFLPGTICYLHAKSLLERRKIFRKRDLLHFVPALLHFIELIPFYLLPIKEKQAALTFYLLNPEKLPKPTVFAFPLHVHFYLKTIVWAFYLILTTHLLTRFYKRNPSWAKRNNPIWLWLTQITSLHILTLIISIAFFTFFDKNTYIQFSIIPAVFFTLSCIIILLFNPKILYGLNPIFIDDDLTILVTNEVVSIKKNSISPLITEDYKAKIEHLISNKKVFLIRNYSIKDMSNDLAIPIHHLSSVINKEYGTNYANFINRHRIDYIIQNQHNAEWSQFSVEGIGAEAGFNSRSTFFKTFKIVTGKTPSEYLKKNHPTHQ